LWGEQEQRRAVAGAADPGNEARPPRARGAVELTVDAVRLEVLAEELGRRGLVSGRVRRVDPDEPAEEVCNLAAQA